MKMNGVNMETFSRVADWTERRYSIPTNMMRDMINEMSEWQEVTSPLVGDRVVISPDLDDISDGIGYSKIVCDDNDGTYAVALKNGELLILEASDFEVVRDTTVPNFHKMWRLDSYTFREWLFDGDGVRIMTELGFRIYYHEEYGFWAGIEVGKGHNVIKDYWIPLYEMLGRTWDEMPIKYMRKKSLMNLLDIQCNIMDTLPGTDIHKYEVCITREDTAAVLLMDWWSSEEPELAVCLHSIVRDARNFELYHDDFLMFESQYKADSIKELADIFAIAEHHHAQLIGWCNNKQEYDWLINYVLS